MDHIAIMRKSWGLIPKVLSGSKKIESRWSVNKVAPWDKINSGDRVFFKNSGEQVTAVSDVAKVLAFDNLNPKLIRGILSKYGGKDGIDIRNTKEVFNWAKKKKYCTLIFLKNSRRISPFSIRKSGFGLGAAWLVVGDIGKVKASPMRSGLKHYRKLNNIQSAWERGER